MDELPKRAAGILAAARDGYGPPGSARDRVYGRILAAVGAATIATGATKGAAALGPASLAPKAAGGLTLASKVGGSVAIAFAVAGGALYERSHRAPADVHVERPTARELVAEVRPAPPRAEPAPLAPAMTNDVEGAIPALPSPAQERTKPVASEAQGVSGPAVTGELKLIREASRALQDGDTGRALSALARHEAQFPGGVLGLERRALRVFALCRSGQVAEARRERATYLATAGDTPMAREVRSTCPEGKGH